MALLLFFWKLQVEEIGEKKFYWEKMRIIQAFSWQMDEVRRERKNRILGKNTRKIEKKECANIEINF